MSRHVLDRLGVFIFPWGRPAPSVDSTVALAIEAEELGFDSVHMAWHHTLPPSGDASRFILDPFVLLPIIASRTSRIRIGLSSGVLPAHHPFVWAQYMASLDVASRGRVIGGAAIGWWEQDLQIGGATKKERGARTNEALDAITRLWSGREIDSPGRFWDASGLAVDPRPIQDPFPLWIGGGPASIERTARWGTGIMPVDMTPAFARDVLRPELDAAANRQGRDVRLELAMMNYAIVSSDDRWIADEVRPWLVAHMSNLSNQPDLQPEETMIFGSPEACAEQMQRFFEAGIDYIVLNAHFHGMESEEFARDQWTRFVEEVVPLVKLD